MWSSYTRDKCGPLTPGINVVLHHVDINVVRDKRGSLTPGINVVLIHQG